MLRKSILFGLALALGASAVAAPVGAAGAPEPARPPAADTRHFTAGEELARTVTLVTGVPISPLLGVSALGAWRYFQTPVAARPALPWYARPWFWGAGLAIVFLFAANTTLGAALPGLKKPMDFVEEHENKLSALLATPIVLLEIHRLLSFAPGVAGALAASSPPLATAGLAAIAGGDAWVRPLVTVGLGALYLACYLVVFVAFHAIQVLIALSPSVLLDMFLRAFRLGLLGLLGLSSTIHPYLGAALGFAVLFVAWLLVGWSFRLSVYGSVLSFDFLAGRDGAADPRTARLAAFAQKGLPGVPVRSFGRLEQDPQGRWRFRFRPWLVLPARRIALPPGELAVLRGAVSPTLVRLGGLRELGLMRFPPRFRGRETELAARLGGAAVRDGRIVRGLKATWRWLKELALGADAADSPAA